jgi:outer membrane protein assembly factor BamA
MKTTVIALAFAATITSFCASAQETRAAEIERAREQKDLTITPDEPSKLERALVWVQTSSWTNSLLHKGDGWRTRIGGMTPTAGFSIGPEYSRTDLFGGALTLRVLAQASIRDYYRGLLQISLPQLLDGKAFVDLSAGHRDYASLAYYGPGPDSVKTGRSDYRLEDTSMELRPGIRPARHLRAGLLGGFTAVNVGPGADSRYISTDRQFTPAATPGIDRQGSFWQTGLWAQYDSGNYSSDATRGGNYSVQWSRIRDRTLGAFSFNRLDVEARHYIPFLNEKRVIAVRAASSLTGTSAGQRAPFYLQPTVGGPDALRGFRSFRFYGNNMAAVSGEYRWEASTALEVALFADGGKVFDKRSQLNIHDLETSYGFGFRFKSQRRIALRIDTGLSREGVQVWLRFNNAF